MEAYFSKLKSQADAQLQGAVDPAALAEKAEEDRMRLQAVRQDALVKMEKIRLKKLEREERQREYLAIKERKYADKIRRMKEEAQRKIMAEIQRRETCRLSRSFRLHVHLWQRKTKRYYEMDNLGRKHHTGVVYFGEHRDTRNAWYPHGPGKLLTEGAERVVYDGTFSQGMIHGSGTYTFENGDKYVGMFRRDKMHGCGQIVYLKDGSSKECIYQNHKRICFTEELVPGTRLRLQRYKVHTPELGTIIEPLSKPGHYRVRVDECNIVALDLGGIPFSIARDLPPVFLLDLVVGDTFAQKRYDYEADISSAPRVSDHSENIFRHEDPWMLKVLEGRRKAKEKAEREERKRLEEQRRRDEAQQKAKAKEKAEVEEALNAHREKMAGEKAAKEQEDKAFQDQIDEAKHKVKVKFGKA